jgi:hypothetical protein
VSVVVLGGFGCYVTCPNAVSSRVIHLVFHRLQHNCFSSFRLNKYGLPAPFERLSSATDNASRKNAFWLILMDRDCTLRYIFASLYTCTYSVFTPSILEVIRYDFSSLIVNQFQSALMMTGYEDPEKPRRNKIKSSLNPYLWKRGPTTVPRKYRTTTREIHNLKLATVLANEVRNSISMRSNYIDSREPRDICRTLDRQGPCFLIGSRAWLKNMEELGPLILERKGRYFALMEIRGSADI